MYACMCVCVCVCAFACACTVCVVLVCLFCVRFVMFMNTLCGSFCFKFVCNNNDQDICDSFCGMQTKLSGIIIKQCCTLGLITSCTT